MARTTIFDRARRHIEMQMKVMQDEHRRNLMRKRLEFVTNGVRAFQNKKVSEAVTNFQSFVKLLEDYKGTGEGGLTPANFDPQKDIGDLLLLSGVYWELTKLFDRTRTEEKKRDFLHYLEKFILFSKGTAYQPLCAESLRRYISNDKPVHRVEFKNAYKVLGDGKCFVVTSLMDVTDFETLPALWKFRDETLRRSVAGRGFIRLYYRVGPLVAAVLDRLPNRARRTVGRCIDALAAKLEPRK